jgi:hypothetical protein
LRYARTTKVLCGLNRLLPLPSANGTLPALPSGTASETDRTGGLANNHVLDFRPARLIETLATLHRTGTTGTQADPTQPDPPIPRTGF